MLNGPQGWRFDARLQDRPFTWSISKGPVHLPAYWIIRVHIRDNHPIQCVHQSISNPWTELPCPDCLRLAQPCTASPCRRATTEDWCLYGPFRYSLRYSVDPQVKEEGRTSGQMVSMDTLRCRICHRVPQYTKLFVSPTRGWAYRILVAEAHGEL